MTTLARLRELLDAATPSGDWEWGPCDYDKYGDELHVISGAWIDAFTEDCGDNFGLSDASAEFIAAAHNALPALLDVVEAAKGARESFKPWSDGELAAWEKFDVALARLEGKS